jgi:hypothetical protein
MKEKIIEQAQCHGGCTVYQIFFLSCSVYIFLILGISRKKNYL